MKHPNVTSDNLFISLYFFHEKKFNIFHKTNMILRVAYRFSILQRYIFYTLYTPAMGIGGGSPQCHRKCRPMWDLRR